MATFPLHKIIKLLLITGEAHELNEYWDSRLAVIAEHPEIMERAAFSEERAAKSAKTYRDFADALEELKLPASAARCREISDRLSRLPVTSIDINKMIPELSGRMVAEMESFVFHYVPHELARYYGKTDLFGPKITTNFFSAAYDVEEAGNCLALERPTACVMHLMRVLESARDAIALGVGVPVTAVRGVASWEQLLRLIRDRIEQNNKTSIPAWTNSRSFYENALAYLHAVKDAWRNPSMHLDRKYTQEEAESIFVAVRNLMRNLAEHLNESGVFTP